MNDINTKQNEERILKYLFAQRYLYSKAKEKFNISFIVSIIILILGLIPSFSDTIFMAFITAIGIILSFVMQLINNNKRKLAVDFQEYVDRYLFGFKIDKKNITNLNKLEEISNELIISNANEYRKEIDPRNRHGVYNWYTDVSLLPLNVARVVCQNENVRWENRQRGLYSNIIIVVILAIMLIFGVKIYIFKEKWYNIFCVFPIIFEFFKVLLANHNVIKSINNAQENINDLYLNIEEKKNKYSKRKFKDESLNIQQCIKDYRLNNISIPDFIYKKMKEKEQIKSTEFITLRVQNILNNL